MSLYQHEPLHRSALKESPVEQFRLWFEDTQRTDLKLPMAMSVSTVGGQGRVSSRVVLLRGYGERGFVFFTNYQSRKAQDLDCHPFAALLFYWEVLGRQVRIEGRAERLSAEESDAYFALTSTWQPAVPPTPHTRARSSAVATKLVAEV